MSSKRISTILDELRVEEADIQRRLTRLRTELKSAETQLLQVRKALSSLKVKPQNGTVGKKPTATKQEVVEAMRNALEAKGPLLEEQLKSQVEESLKAQDKALTGFAMRFKNALSEDQFARNGSQLSLVDSGCPEFTEMTAERP